MVIVGRCGAAQLVRRPHDVTQFSETVAELDGNVVIQVEIGHGPLGHIRGEPIVD